VPSLKRVDHVIVCGLRHVGLRLIEQLHGAGEDVVVIDDHPDDRLVRLVQDWGVHHVEGSARRAETLVRAGVETAASLVCADLDDLDNLDVALLARRIRPDLRVVLHLTNPAVGRAMTRVTGPGTVLDVPSLAAPSFVEACLDRRRHKLLIGDEDFTVVELAADAAGTVRTMAPGFAPIALIPAAGGDMLICPSRDVAVGTGDLVAVVGREFDLRAVRPEVDELEVRVPRPAGRARVAWRYLASFAEETGRAIRLTLIGLIAVGALSVILLMSGYSGLRGQRMNLIDSVYFTTETLTTTGFGDFSFAAQSPWLRVWSIFLMITGATLLTITYALLTDLLVSRRIAQSLGQKHVTDMREHVILVGLGLVGLRVLEALVAVGQAVVVLEQDENNRHLGIAESMGVPVVIGDSTTATSLEAVNLSTARGVAIVTSNDLANIETGLAVGELLGDRREEVPVVLRIFDRQLAHTVETSFGFRYVRSPSELSAPWFVGAALGLDVLNTFYVEHQPFLLGRLTVREAGGLVGRTVRDLSARIRVVAVERAHGGKLEYPADIAQTFQADDRAYLIGPYEDLLAVLRRDRARGSSRPTPEPR
jgi:Trk K+ transport system NAD-binding subunit